MLWQNDLQFGFRDKYSTSHALIRLTDKIRAQLDSGNFTCGILVDLQKAFDIVDHDILTQKSNHHDIRGLASNCFYSYLQNWSMVSLKGLFYDPYYFLFISMILTVQSDIIWFIVLQMIQIFSTH